MIKKVLITGGTKGVGYEAVKRFAQNDEFEVFALGQNFDQFHIRNVQTIKFDLQNIDKLEEILKKTGFVDVLINNAAIMHGITFQNYTEKLKNQIMKINLEAPVKLMTIYGKQMKQQQKGKIINISSIAGFIGHPDIWYGITKAGLLNATKTIAKELAPYGITVNSIAPGPIETSMLNTIPEHRLEMLKNQAYDKRFSTPSEIVDVIYWLSTQAPLHLTGSCIDMHSGAFPR